jgi:KTSC domain
MNDIIDEILGVLSDMLENGEEIPEYLLDQLEDAISQREGLGNGDIEAPLPNGSEMLWHLSNANPDVFTSYLRSVPDPALNALLRNPTQLNSTIQTLAERYPKGQPSEMNGIPKAPLNSSNIYGFSYDQNSGTLKVRFQGDGVYQYQGIPPYIFNIFQKGAVPAKTSGTNNYGAWWKGKNPSLGAAFYDLIRSGPYPYQKVA